MRIIRIDGLLLELFLYVDDGDNTQIGSKKLSVGGAYITYEQEITTPIIKVTAKKSNTIKVSEKDFILSSYKKKDYTFDVEFDDNNTKTVRFDKSSGLKIGRVEDWSCLYTVEFSLIILS